MNGIADILVANISWLYYHQTGVYGAYCFRKDRQLTHDCSMHFIKTSALRDLILSAIREISTFVRSDEKEFLHLVREETNAGIKIAAREQKKQLHKAEKRIVELDWLIKKLYEGNAASRALIFISTLLEILHRRNKSRMPPL